METRRSWMTRPWLSVRRSVRGACGDMVREAATLIPAYAFSSHPPKRRCLHGASPGGARGRNLVDTWRPATQREAGEAEADDQTACDGEVIRHGMLPPRRIAEVLAYPEQQYRGDDGELAGDHEEGMAQFAALVERLHLTGRQIALFRGKQGVRHRFVLLAPAS